MGSYSNRKKGAKGSTSELHEDRTGIAAVIMVCIVCLAVIVAIIMSVVNYTRSVSDTTHAMASVASLQKSYKSIKPQTTTSQAERIDLGGAEKKLSVKYAELVRYLYGGLKSEKDFERNSDVIETWFSPGGVDKIKQSVLFQNGKEYLPVATKNEDVYVTFGSVNYVTSIVTVTIYTTYKTNKSAYSTGQGQALITLWYDVKRNITGNLTVQSSAVSD